MKREIERKRDEERECIGASGAVIGIKGFDAQFRVGRGSK